MTIQNQNTGKNLVLDEALVSLERGWSVMPISRTSKTPMVSWLRWQEELPSVVKVRNWFGADYPDANLGIITGALSRVVIIDVDEQIGHQEIERRGGMPDTVTVRTSEDWKLHFYFEHPGFHVKNFQKKCGDEKLPGLDFRGDGGYAMLPPSLHMKSGQPYTWLIAPDEGPIAPMPDWILEVLQHRIDKENAPAPQGDVVPIPAPDQANDRARNYVLSALEKERAKLMNCGDGERHAQRYNSAMALAGYMPLLSEQEIIDGLSVNFGKSRQNGLDTIADGIRNGKAKPRALPASVNGSNGHYTGSNSSNDRVAPPLAVVDEAEPAQRPQAGVDIRGLDERGVLESTLLKFKLSRVTRTTAQFENFDCYEFPTWTPAGRAGRTRFYSIDPSATGGERYLSDDATDGARLPLGYNLYFVCERLALAPGEVWLLGDEFSVWMAHQAGLMAVSMFSLGADPAGLVRELKKRGASKLHLCLGVGEQANVCALKAAYAALKAKLPFTIRNVPIPRDGAALWELRPRVQTDAAFAQTVANLPVWSLPKLREMTPDSEEQAPNAPDPKGTKAERMLELLEAIEGMEVFRTELGDCYLSIPRDQHTEVWPLPSGKLANFCRHHYHRETSRVIDGGTVENVLGVLHGRAMFEGELREAPTRVQQLDGRIYIDLCDEDWQVVEIGEDIDMGWRIIQNPPVAFRRAKGMEALPVPQRGGNWKQLQHLLGLSGENWVLALSWMLMAWRPSPSSYPMPYPVLAVHGEQESGKSTLCKMIRTLIDPNFTTLLGTSTRDEEELMIRAKNSYVVGFDNLSKMPQWMNDAICSLVTEGSFAKRSLYSNDEEELFKSQRPVILNGINENLGKNDFRRRVVKLILPAREESEKREEIEHWAEFHAVWPKVLGLLCDAICFAQINLPSVELTHKRGLVDFAKWVTAAEPMLPWPVGQFSDAYLVNQQKAIETANEADSFTLTVIDYIDTRRFYKGTVGDFRTELKNFADESVLREPGWPKTASTFGERLNRVMPNLRAVGIHVTRLPRQGAGQMIDIRRPSKAGLDEEEIPAEVEVEST